MAAGKRPAAAKTKKSASARSTSKSAPRAATKRAPAKAGKSATAKTAKAPARKAASPARTVMRATPRAKPAPAVQSTARSAPPAASVRAATDKGALKADKLYQIAMTATDLDASVVFYRDTLGLRFIARYEPPGLVFFSLGGGMRLMLSATASAASLYFLVDDLKAAHREFTRRGVRFLQPPALIHRDEAGDFGKKGGEEWMAFFHDPAGNTLALVERRR